MSRELLSMTGFGRATVQEGAVTLEVEVRSVNHRFLDLAVKVPRVYGQFESELRRVVSEHLSRGRVELFVVRRAEESGARTVSFDQGLFTQLKQIYSRALGQQTDVSDARIAFEVLSRREVVEIGDESSSAGDNEKDLLIRTVREAVRQLQHMRASEGASLRNDLSARLELLRAIHSSISSATARHPDVLRERLLQRVQKLAPEITIDPARLASEVALLSDRVDTTEELVRLGSHFEQTAQVLSSGGGAGRKLDFLIQEMGREFNTITSKAQDAAVQHLVIEGKAELERMKEQVQNVE